MKKLVFTLFLLISTLQIQAQVINMGNGSATTCSATFYDSGGSFGNYASNESYVLTFCPNSALNCIQANFLSFDIENGFDYLYIYDGNSTASPLIGVYTGTVSPGTITATAGCLTFEFVSDFIITAPGWAANISCVPCGSGGPCLPNMGPGCSSNTCASSFFDDGGSAGTYSPNSNMVHTVCAASNCLQINWNSFDVENGFDFLNIYDGPSTASTSLGSYTGTTLPPTIISSTGCLTFEFFSDGIIQNAGWDATLSCILCGSGPAATTADCDSSIQVCSATTSFPITANGFGSFNEIPPSGSLGNPAINPASLNDGCLLNDELNSTWLIFQIQTGGVLEYVFGGPLYPQTGYTDWIMYELTSATCADIPANNLAPSRCNWNCATNGGTGILAPANIPATSSACNFEPTMNVSAGQRFVICFTNWSNVNGTVGFEFMTAPGNAVVDCNPILHYNDIYLEAAHENGSTQLNWLMMNPEMASTFEVLRNDGTEWISVGTKAPLSGQFNYTFVEAGLNPGSYEYRIRMQGIDGGEVYSNVETIEIERGDMLAIYPNPAKNLLTLQFAELTGEKQLALLDAMGKILVEKRISENALNPNGTLEISLVGLQPGLYFIRTQNETLRFIKE